MPPGDFIYRLLQPPPSEISEGSEGSEKISLKTSYILHNPDLLIIFEMFTITNPLSAMKALAFLSALLISLSAYASEPFNGRIIDFTGKPVRRAKVYVNNPKYFTKSDKEGRFGLTDVQPDDTLHVVIGRKTHKIPVDGAKGISIKIEKEQFFSEEDLELVNMGMGYVRKREYLAPRSGVTHEQLVATGETDLIPALRGLMPGVFVSSYTYKDADDNVFSATKINIRNATSLYASTAPLWVVDGSESTTPPSLTVMEVESVEVLKDGAGYGTRGANGVIIVRLRDGIGLR